MTIQGIPCPSDKACFGKQEGRCRILSEVYPKDKCPFQKPSSDVPDINLGRVKRLHDEHAAIKMAIKIKNGTRKTLDVMEQILELEDCLQAARIKCLKKHKVALK